MTATTPATARETPTSRTSLADDASPWPRGTAIDRYIVIDELGAGGMGVVLAAYDHVLDRKVALKLVTPRPDAPDATDRHQALLLAEAQAMAKLSHPAIVAIHDVGEHRGRVFIAMEFVDGRTLRRYMAEQPTSVTTKLAMLREIGAGLAAAHRAGIVHRDFKPDNVLVDGHGHAKIADFGIAKHVAGLLSPSIDDAASAGTPGYMAPEQATGQPTDARTDQYAFCITAMEILTGSRGGGEPTVRSIPGRIARALRRGASADPAARWPTMDALLAAIAPRTRRSLVIVGGLAIVGTIAVLVATRPAAAPELDCATLAERATATWSTTQSNALRANGAEATRVAAIDGQFSTWQAAWTTTAVTSCKATRAGTQAAALHAIRQRCLDLELARVEGVARDLVGKDPERSALAATIVPELLAHPGCDRDDELLGWAPSLPAPDQQSELIATQAEVIRAAAISEAGDFARATTLFAPLLARVEKLGFAPAIAEAHLLAGTNAMRAGDGPTAATSLFRAIVTGEASRSGRIVTNAWLRLVYVEGYLLDNVREALAFGEIARSLLHRDPSNADVDAEIVLDGSLGSLLADHGRAREAVPMLERQVAHYESRESPENLVSGLQALAGAHVALEAPETARPLVERALAIATRAYGPDHPNVVIVASQLIEVLVRGRHPREAIAVADPLLSNHDLPAGLRAVMLRDRGYAHVLLDNRIEARRDLEAAIQLLVEATSADDGELQRARYYLAELERTTGHDDRARVLLERALLDTRDVPNDRRAAPSYIPHATLEAALASLARAPSQPHR